jgi:hypothetical protein
MAKIMIAARRSVLRLMLFAMLTGLARAARASAADAGRRVVVDWRTGLAIHGFDPVAYFSEAKPVPGKAECEHLFSGATWRFRNEGNRAAFIAAPDAYLPRFGGYDALAMARGVAVPGNPLVWLMFAGRLYLFHSSQSRAAFAADPRTAVAAADETWPQVMQALTP